VVVNTSFFTPLRLTLCPTLFPYTTLFRSKPQLNIWRTTDGHREKVRNMSNEPRGLWKDWRLHAVVLGIVILTEMIGTFEIAIGAGVILLLPMLYAVVIGLGTFFTPLINKAQSKKAETLVFMSVTLLIAKFGVEAGPALPELIRAGPALILQEIGNLATVLVALPVAI